MPVRCSQSCKRWAMESENGTVAELLPREGTKPEYEPVTDGDLMKIIREESIPVGVMLVHLVRAATAADVPVVDSAVREAEDTLAALKTVQTALKTKFPAPPLNEKKTKRRNSVRRTSRPRKRIKPAAVTEPVESAEPDDLDREYPGMKGTEIRDPRKYVPKRARTSQPNLINHAPSADTPQRQPPYNPQARPELPVGQVPERWKPEAYERRLKLAKLLLDGHLRVMDLAERGNIPSGSICSVLDCCWFNKTSDGVYLTPQGRAAASPD